MAFKIRKLSSCSADASVLTSDSLLPWRVRAQGLGYPAAAAFATAHDSFYIGDCIQQRSFALF